MKTIAPTMAYAIRIDAGPPVARDLPVPRKRPVPIYNKSQQEPLLGRQETHSSSNGYHLNLPCRQLSCELVCLNVELRIVAVGCELRVRCCTIEDGDAFLYTGRIKRHCSEGDDDSGYFIGVTSDRAYIYRESSAYARHQYCTKHIETWRSIAYPKLGRKGSREAISCLQNGVL